MTNASNASTRTIVDTNILLYAFDTAEPTKRPIAEKLIQEHMRERRLVLSVQNLNEFYNIITRRNRAFSMTHEDAVKTLGSFAANCEILPLTPDIPFRALDAIARYRMSLWDALIWAVAKQNGISVIYTEDMPGAPDIEGVSYINPFVTP